MSHLRALALALAGALLIALAFICIDVEPFYLFGIESPEEPELSALPRAPQVMRALSAAARSLRARSHHIVLRVRALRKGNESVVPPTIVYTISKALLRLKARRLLFYLSRPEAAPPYAFRI